MEKSDFDDSNFVGFKHDIFPDVMFTHIPKITFVSYISNFGGLMGMWLGANLLDIFKYFHCKITNFFICSPKYIRTNERQSNFMSSTYHNYFS